MKSANKINDFDETFTAGQRGQIGRLNRQEG